MSSDLPSHHVFSLGLVLQRLSVVDRLRCERVSPRFNQAALEWGWREQRTLDQDTLFEGVPEERVADFRIRFWANGYKNLISLLDRAGPHLRELDLDSFRLEWLQPFVQQIGEAIQRLPSLHVLNIKKFDLTDFVDFLPPTLRRLKTGWFPRIRVQTLEALAEKCPRLEKVPFRRVEGLTLEVLNEFIGRFPSQKLLTIPNMDTPYGALNAGTFAAILALENLRALKFCPSHAFDDERSFRAICSGCPGLRRFSFHIGRLAERALFQLAQMPRLVQLEIDGYGKAAFTHDVLKRVADCGQLKSLVVDHSELTDESIEYLLDACKSLVHLNVLHSPNITDRSLQAVVAEVHRRYGGNPPRALPSGPSDPGIFYFPCVGMEEYSFANEMSYRELEGSYNQINWEWAKAAAENNPWLCVTENLMLEKKRKFY